MQSLLVIDDEASILHAFQRAFRGEPDLQVLTASSASEGLEIFKQEKPHVVVLDIYLPDLSGMDTYQQIRASDARTPVIFITGHGTTDTAIEAMKSGAFDYLLKPLEQVVERSGLHGLDGRVGGAVAGNEDHRGPGIAGADLLIGVHPREVGQIDIEHHHMGLLLFEDLEPFTGRGSREYLQIRFASKGPLKG